MNALPRHSRLARRNAIRRPGIIPFGIPLCLGASVADRDFLSSRDLLGPDQGRSPACPERSRGERPKGVEGPLVIALLIATRTD
jgi:hypothetical protein